MSIHSDLPEAMLLDIPEIEIKGKRFSELALREPNAGEILAQMKAMGKDSSDASALNSQMDLLASVAGVPREVINSLPQRVLMTAIEFVNSFHNVDSSELVGDSGKGR